MTNEAVHFNEPISREELEQVAARLRDRNMEAVVVPDGSRARNEDGPHHPDA